MFNCIAIPKSLLQNTIIKVAVSKGEFICVKIILVFPVKTTCWYCFAESCKISGVNFQFLPLAHSGREKEKKECIVLSSQGRNISHYSVDVYYKQLNVALFIICHRTDAMQSILDMVEGEEERKGIN